MSETVDCRSEEEREREERIEHLNWLHGINQIDDNVASILDRHGPEVECVLMGPMGQTDVMPARELLDFANERYDHFDYPELRACTVDAYVESAKAAEGTDDTHHPHPQDDDQPSA